MKIILLVDDDKKLCPLLSSYLTSLDFKVCSVSDVPSALSFIRTSCPDMVISDIMMQDLNGYDLIKVIKLDKLLNHLPVIFLTAKGMTADRIKGYNLGCHAYLSKPFDPQELQAIIYSVFSNIDLLDQYSPRASTHEGANLNSVVLHGLNLTSREQSILFLVLKGYMNKEIARSLNVSVRNVEKYITRLLNKTNTRNRTHLMRFIYSLRANDGSRTRA